MRRGWETVFVAFVLIFSLVASSGFVPPAFAHPQTIATMNLWSPYDPDGFDGDPEQEFTLSADALAGGTAQLVELEWDFDGDGTVDDSSAVSGSSVSDVTVNHTYFIDGFYNPAVRAVDSDGFTSDWDQYDPTETILLDVGWDPAITTMQAWSPLTGDANTEFTFTADAVSDVGLDALLWDFDGDGQHDELTPISGNSVTGITIAHTYGTTGSFLPQVAALDLQGFVGEYDQYDIDGEEQTIDIGGAAPVAIMNEWSPFDPEEPDGGPLTVFTFSADATAPDGIASIEWDFNGDEVVDDTTAISGVPTSVTDVTTTHTYGTTGIWLPAVRVVDINGATSWWAFYLIDDGEVELDVEATELTVALDFSPNEPSPLPDGLVGTEFTFTVTASSPNPITQYEWDFEGDLVFDQTTTGPTTTFTYGGPGTYLPWVQVTDDNGNTGGASPLDGLGEPDYVLVVSEPVATMNAWDPYNPTGSDGIPSTEFTFSADASFGGGITSIEWDFDGDGNADQTDAVSDSPTSITGATVTHTYGTTGTWTPQVRVSGIGGYTSDWDQFDSSGSPIDLEVSNAPVATMNAWDPYNPTGSDGSPTTTFTFSADGSSSAGVAKIEWDFDGDGTADDETVVSGAPTSASGVTTTHSYGATGTWTPKARVVDVNGINSAWDAYDVSGTEVDLETAASPEATLTGWAPFFETSTDGYPDTNFTFSADASAPDGIATIEWDFNGDGTVDDTTAISGAPTSTSDATASHSYGTTGTWTPKVRVVDVNGNASPWTAHFINENEIELEVVERPVALMNRWSPYNPIGADGYPGTLFTFSADGSAGAGILQLEWDFHGDGVVDRTQTVNDGPLSLADIQTQFAYTFADDFIPHVRIVDVNGVESAWDTYDESSIEIVLDVVTPPVATMNEWSPYNPAGADGTPGTGFTFTADVSAGAGIDRVEWDFDGDGTVDDTVTIANGQTSVDDVTATHTYGTVGVWTPQVRVIDGLGAVSDWNPLDVDGTPIQLETATGSGGEPPSATMNVWSPYDPDGPDGNPETEFTFSVSGFATNGIASIEWDFDGDGTVDLVTPVSGSPISITGVEATHTYGTTGTWVPKARIVDVTGAASPWDAYDISGSEVSLDVDSGPVADTYCDDMTIEQLIASGQYHVIDKRNSSSRIVIGTSGADLILANDLDNYIDGRGGNDCIIAFGGDDEVYDFNGSATSGGTDWLFGGDGNDKLYALNGDDYVFGGNGDDYMQGWYGNDHLEGGDGNDTIEDVNGNDYIDGGDGIDNCFDQHGNNTIINCEDEPPVGDTYCDDMTIEQLIASGRYNVIDNRDGKRKTLVGTQGDDLILAGAYGDTINGLNGDDCIIGGDGKDKINGNSGDDQIYGGDGNDKIHGNHGKDVIYGGEGNDILYGNQDDDVIYGGDGNDKIDGHDGDDQLYGEAGNDDINGDSGDDYIDGGAGSDECEDGYGDDTVVNCEEGSGHNHNDDDEDDDFRNIHADDDDDDEDDDNRGNGRGNNNDNGNRNR